LAHIGFGATLGYDAAGGSSFTSVSNLVSISGIGSDEIELVDATHLGSANKRKQYIGGARETAEISAECHYSEASYNALVALLGDETCTWRITFPEESSPLTFTFTGILTKLETDIEMDSVVTLKLTIKVNSAITIA